MKPTSGDNSKSIRQKTYLRALATIPQIEVFLGSFQAHPVRRPLADRSGSVVVMDMKEKGSDVNLATELLVDGFTNAYDVAAIITNDSDLAAPVRAVGRLGKAVGVLNPHRRQSIELQKCASFIKAVRPWALQQSLLPALLTDANGDSHSIGWTVACDLNEGSGSLGTENCLSHPCPGCGCGVTPAVDHFSSQLATRNSQLVSHILAGTGIANSSSARTIVRRNTSAHAARRWRSSSSFSFMIGYLW